MIIITLTCRHCDSEKLVPDGHTSNGQQRFCCTDCQRSSRQNPQPNGYTAAEREQILRAYEERSSLRTLERSFAVSRYTVSAWLKKKKLNSRS